MRSLKAILMTWVATLTIGLAAIAGLSLYLLARVYLLEQFDTSMIYKARLLSSTIKLEYNDLDMEFEDLDMSEFDSADAGGYLQVWLDGKSVYRSPSLGRKDLPTNTTSCNLSSVRCVNLPGG